MNEFLYDISSWQITATLLVSMLVAIEIGYRIGRRHSVAADAAMREHINAIQGAILGILALLLGFTFSLSLQRFDTRSEGVVAEANAIGTAYLRAGLLPVAQRSDIRDLMRDYVDLRVQASALTMIERPEREALLAQSIRVQNALWEQARQATDANPGAHPPALFAAALNELIDSFGRRNAALERHVPEIVLLLLHGTFVMAGAIVGFASGMAGHRPSLASYIMVLLIAVLVFIIMDLDRPRRGLIQVSQRSLVDLQASIRADSGAAPGQLPAAKAQVPAGGAVQRRP